MTLRIGRRRWRWKHVVAGVAVAAGMLTANVPHGVNPWRNSPTKATAPSSSSATTGDQSGARRLLDQLEVKGRAPKSNYRRTAFGHGWIDIDRNGCDTRNDMLKRDLRSVAFKPGTNECVVVSGVLADPYTGTSISFTKGNKTSTAVQIDHVVALGDAWQKGAQSWTDEKRVQFANDPDNLLAVDGKANLQKGDGDAATWLPHNKSFRCEYVTRQIQVKATYSLWVTRAERDAMARVLGACPR